MHTDSLSYDLKSRRWSQDSFPASDSPRTLILAFGSPEFVDHPRVLADLARQYPRSLMIGCSTAGEIHGAAVRDNSLAVTVSRFDKTDLQLASIDVTSIADSYSAGKALALRLTAKPGLRAVMVLSEGLNVNGTKLIQGINDVVDDKVVVTGGLSGDGANFKRTWVAVGTRVQANVVAAVGFYGDYIHVTHGSKGGWDKFGPERVVTRSEGNVLYELDNKPALALYKEYLGDKAKDLPASGLLFPLSLRANAKDDKFVVRTLLAVDHEANSMTFAGDVPTGHLVQLMRAHFDRLVDGARIAAEVATQGRGPDESSLVVAISCVGRRLVLGARIEEEVEAVRDAISPNAQITGFYSYGEISPYGIGKCDLHNQTMTVTMFAETETPLVAGVHGRSAVASVGVRAGGAPPPPLPTSIAAVRASRPSIPITIPTSSSASAPVAVAITAPAARSTAFAKVDPDVTAVEGLPLGPIVRIPRAGGTELQIRTTDQDGLKIVGLSGRLTEAFRGAPLGQTLSGRVVFDLADVDRVTSFGVREWLAMFAAADRISECFFMRCSESIVNQLTMIRKFDGGARVVSFFAPYLCDSCGAGYERLFDCERDAAEIASAAPASATCPRCNEVGSFDDDPRSYFAFANAHLRGALPADIRQAHNGLVARIEDHNADEIEKWIEPDCTRLRINAKLTSQLRWRRMLEGIEGALKVDLSASTGADAAGAAELVRALAALPLDVASIEIEHAPALVVSKWLEAVPARVAIVSTTVDAFCKSCNASRPSLLVLRDYIAEHARNDDFRIPCKRCNADVELRLSTTVQQVIAKHAAREAVVAAIPATVAGASEKLGVTPSTSALVAIAAVAAPPPAVAPVVSMSAGPGKSPSRLATVGAMILAAGAGAGIFYVATRSRGATVTPRGDVASSRAAITVPAQVAALAVASNGSAMPPVSGGTPSTGSASNGWQASPDLPPAWVESKLSIDSDVVLLVGEAIAPTLERASAAARANGVLRLLDAVTHGLDGSKVSMFVAPRLRHDDNSANAEIVARFERQFGDVAALERTDVASRTTADGVQAFVRYRLKREVFDKLLEAYRSTASFRGVTVARFFPALAATIRTSGELVVIDVMSRSAAELAGIRAGDVILDIAGQPVSSIVSFQTVSAQAWGAIAPRQRLQLRVESAGASRDVQLVKPSIAQ